MFGLNQIMSMNNEQLQAWTIRENQRANARRLRVATENAKFYFYVKLAGLAGALVALFIFGYNMV